MDLQNIPKWAGDHPYATGGIVFGVGLVLLWYFGVFSGSSAAASNTSGNNLASAFYAAEAAQATAGTQLQLATVQATNQTAQVQSQADAAVKIASAQSATSLGIASSQFGASTTINGQNTAAAEAIASTNAHAAVDIQHTSALTSLQAALAQITGNVSIADINARTQQDLASKSLISQWIPFAASLSAQNRATFGTGGSELYFDPATGSVQSGQTSLTPAALSAQGFTPTQINTILGVGA